jgi:hypothetical protein
LSSEHGPFGEPLQAGSKGPFFHRCSGYSNYENAVSLPICNVIRLWIQIHSLYVSALYFTITRKLPRSRQQFLERVASKRAATT